MEIYGYEFKVSKLLETALTVPSYRMLEPAAADNQRLEFLGDAVLQILASEHLYASRPGEDEGLLTVRRAHMVSATALCAVAAETKLVERLRYNRNAERPPASAKVYADAVEAVFGAAYLDGGLDAARKIFDALGLAAKEYEDEWAGNPKGALQVKSQALHPPRLPEYRLVSRSGQSHAPVFTIRVSLEGVGEAEASAGSKREAEAKAAEKLLKSQFGNL